MFPTLWMSKLSPRAQVIRLQVCLDSYQETLLSFIHEGSGRSNRPKRISAGAVALVPPTQDPTSALCPKAAAPAALTQPLYAAQGWLFANSSLHIERDGVGPLPSSLHLHISDPPHSMGPLPWVEHPTLWVRLGSFGALSSSSELLCSSSDVRSSLGVAAKMGQTL